MSELLRRMQDGLMEAQRELEDQRIAETNRDRHRAIYIERIFEDDPPDIVEDIVRQLTDARDLIDAAIADAQTCDLQRVARSAVLITELKNGVELRLKMYIPLHIAAAAIQGRHHDE